MELPALVIFLYFIISYSDIRNTVVMLATILWSVHYFHRAIVFPLRIRTSGKKMPIIIMLFAFVFNLVNASLNGYWLGTLYPKSELEGIILLRVIVGLLLFITGFIINQYHDQILIRLRNSNKNGYKIPYGGFFRYISCPNFFGEIVEWGGFALLTWGLPSLSFFIWSMVNLIPRAIEHHKWYIRNFPEYPKERKAIIPFLY
jgi:steroid 5-alpha reductase family enzyme